MSVNLFSLSFITLNSHRRFPQGRFSDLVNQMKAGSYRLGNLIDGDKKPPSRFLPFWPGSRYHTLGIPRSISCKVPPFASQMFRVHHLHSLGSQLLRLEAAMTTFGLTGLKQRFNEPNTPQTSSPSNQKELGTENVVSYSLRESDDDIKPVYDSTCRKLKPRHIQLIGIGG